MGVLKNDARAYFPSAYYFRGYIVMPEMHLLKVLEIQTEILLTSFFHFIHIFHGLILIKSIRMLMLCVKIHQLALILSHLFCIKKFT